MIPANEDAVLAQIDAQLFAQGWVHLPRAIPDELLHALQAELAELDAKDLLTPAAVGRGDGQQIVTDIRGDRTVWLEPEWPAAAAYLAWMEHIRMHLNRTAFLGLAELEAHYACYPAGSFYKRHVDQHEHTEHIGHRVVSTVVYLNAMDWPAQAGGELVLYPANSPQQRIVPGGGDMVLFWSDTIPHEVLPATQERRSIAGWFRTRDVGLPR